MFNKLLKENKKSVNKARQQGIKVQQLSKKEIKKQVEQLINLRQVQINESSEMRKIEKEMTRDEVIAYNQKVAEQNKKYCYCRGKLGKDPDDFYIACDGKNCENNGWYHWKCIPELRFKSKTELDNMKEWYCLKCKEKSEPTEIISKDDGKKKLEGKFSIFLLFLTFFFLLKFSLYSLSH
jgi:hypothetical protein